MKYAFVFSALGLVCLYGAFSSHNFVVPIVLFSNTLCWLGVGAAFGLGRPQVFGKRYNGSLAFWSWLVFWPFHLLNALSLQLFRWTSREPWTKINDKLYLGCRLNKRDTGVIKHLQSASVLDLTCEFSEIVPLRQLPYKCLPLLDTFAPSEEQLADGVQWIEEQIRHGPVYVHCALGHGRSATIVVAYLMRSQNMSFEEAVKYVSRLRSGVELKPQQVRVLEQLSTSMQPREGENF